MWPLLAFAAMIVIVLVWLEARLGPPPAYRRLRVWARLLPCGCTELWVVRYTARLNWASTRVCIRPGRYIQLKRYAVPALVKTRELLFG